jgi:hypothetical protein
MGLELEQATFHERAVRKETKKKKMGKFWNVMTTWKPLVDDRYVPWCPLVR